MAQTPFGSQSLAELVRLVPIGTTVKLQKDVTAKDVYDRTLAYVWVGPVLINELMVERGYALSYRFPPDTLMARRIDLAQSAAETANVGLWRTGGFACPPFKFRRGDC